jgi:3-methyladenine DNA glycosylase AlkD
MNARAEAEELAGALRARSDPRRATQERRYLKSDLEHIGVPMPTLRTAAKSFVRSHPDATRRDVLGIVRALWAHPVHELRVLAVEVLILNRSHLEASDAGLIECFIRESKTWALVDTLAVNVAGDLVERFDELARTLDRWAADDDYWVRRSALLALLKPLRRGDGDFERFGRYADAMLDEREFFIRKAIGWILRETSKKQPRLVYDWLLPRASRASGVTLREAVKYLPERQRSAIEKARHP